MQTHVSSPRLPSGHSGPVLIIRSNDAACASQPSPRLLVADASIWATSLLVVTVRLVLCMCVCVCVCAFSWFCCLLRFQKSLQTHHEEVSYCVETSLPSQHPPQGGSSFLHLLSLFLSFYIFSYHLLKRMGCLSVYLVSYASIQKLFSGSCSIFK